MVMEVRIMVVFGSEHEGDSRGIGNVLYLDLRADWFHGCLQVMRIIELYTYVHFFVCDIILQF